MLFRELRLTEAIHEPHICENILQYNVHAERKGSLRYAKGMSETMQTLHGLVSVSLHVSQTSYDERFVLTVLVLGARCCYHNSVCLSHTGDPCLDSSLYRNMLSITRYGDVSIFVSQCFTAMFLHINGLGKLSLQ